MADQQQTKTAAGQQVSCPASAVADAADDERAELSADPAVCSVRSDRCHAGHTCGGRWEARRRRYTGAIWPAAGARGGAALRCVIALNIHTCRATQCAICRRSARRSGYRWPLSRAGMGQGRAAPPVSSPAGPRRPRVAAAVPSSRCGLYGALSGVSLLRVADHQPANEFCIYQRPVRSSGGEGRSRDAQGALRPASRDVLGAGCADAAR